MKYTLLICLLAGAVTATRAQCPDNNEFMRQITGIEANDAAPGEKIRQLTAVQQQLLQCHRVKDSVYARILHRLGNIYRETGDMEKGEQYTLEAAAINASGKPGAQRAFLANSYFNLGLLYDQLSAFPVSRRYFDSAILIGTQYPDKMFIAIMAAEKKAYSFYRNGDYEKSMQAAENGLVLARREQNTQYIFLLLLQLAQAELKLGQVKEAAAHLKDVPQLIAADNMPPDFRATAYSIYANLLQKQQHYQAAADWYIKAWQLNFGLQNWLQCSRDLLDLGTLYDRDMHNTTKALEAYRKGLNILERTHDPYQRSALYINMGVAYWRKHQYNEALRCYQHGLNALPVGFTDTAVTANPAAGMLKLVANDYYVYTLLANKGEALLELPPAALRYALHTFEMADKAVDQMRRKQLGEGSKQYWREKTKAMYEKAIETCYRLKNPEKAFYFFEKSRAVLLNDKLSELGARKLLPVADAGREQTRRSRILRLQEQLAAETTGSTAYARTKNELLLQQDSLDQLVSTLENTYPSYFRYKYDTVVPALREVQAMLGKQSLITYFTGDSAVYILAIMPGRTVFLRSVFPSYNSIARDLLALCADKSLLNRQYPRYKQLAFRLYDTLFHPLQVPPGRVIISPDDHFIPFDALLSDTATGNSFLLRRYAFSYTYSARFLTRPADNRASLKRAFLGAAPVNYANQPALDGSDASLREIGAHFSPALLLQGPNATRQRFLQALPTSRIVHIYTHADADSTGKEPVLYFADSALQLSALQTLQAPATEMAVLAACGTGTGKNIRGEGVFSIARGFAAAGIPATVTTLWQVDNQPTYRLTELFYEFLQQGLPKDVAMQRAKLTFLKSADAVYALPYCWAPVIVVGKTDVLPPSHPNRWLYYMIAAGAALLLTVLLLLIFWRRKRARWP